MHAIRRTRLRLIAIAATMALAACSRAPTGEAVSGAAASPASDADAAAAGDGARGGAGSVEAYYAALVARHGQDTAQCPPAEAPDAAACGAEAVAGMPAAPRRVLLMLDASGSMAGRQGGQTKLAIAQDALLGFASRIGGDAQVALRVYGHRGGNRAQDKAASCRATELVQPFAPRDAEAFAAAVRGFQPSGFTPIASSLQAAARDFADGGATDDGNVVYLVSDGIETCDGDPAAAARALRAADIGVVVNVIGFDVDATAERQLRDVAAAGGGDYIAARDGEALAAAFNARLDALNARFNCRVSRAADAYNRTVTTHADRYNCLVTRAGDEFNAIVDAAAADANAGRATLEQRDHAVDQAGAKRDRIVEPAKAERDAAVARSSAARDGNVDAASDDRAAAARAAAAQRPR